MIYNFFYEENKERKWTISDGQIRSIFRRPLTRDSFPSHGSSSSKVPLSGVPVAKFTVTSRYTQTVNVAEA